MAEIIAPSGARATPSPARSAIAARLLALGVVLGLLGLLAWGLTGDRTRLGTVPLEGKPASDFELERFDGGTLRLSELHGKPVVLNFWASWCQPCREEAPLLEAAARARPDIVFIGINIQDKRPDAEAYLSQFGISYPNVLDAKGTVSIDYGVSGIPETFFIDRTGRIVKKWIGPLNQAQLRQYLERIT